MRTDEVVAAVFAALEKDRCLTVQELAAMLGLTYATVQSTLTQDIGLAKKSSCWAPKLLSTAQKEESSKRNDD
jgi:hypothetical protein